MAQGEDDGRLRRRSRVVLGEWSTAHLAAIVVMLWIVYVDEKFVQS